MQRIVPAVCRQEVLGEGAYTDRPGKKSVELEMSFDSIVFEGHLPRPLYTAVNIGS